MKCNSNFLGLYQRWGGAWLLPVFFCFCGIISAAELHVGPGKPFQRIEDALAKARPGDTLLIHSLPKNEAYPKVALLIRTPRLTFRAVPDVPGESVPLSGDGFNYSGAGRVPRAIVQFDPAAEGCALDGFELFGAHNKSCNGAGVRINQANDILITRCEIRDNDMGIMSNGDAGATPPTGDRQRIEHCRIHHNGSTKDPGYNHNLYLGGTSVTVFDCEVYASLTGHNIKSRAHLTRVIHCLVHDSANREIDLVDEEGNTTIPDSHALLLGNVIIKERKGSGNRNVIHFGQDGGRDHHGTLYLVHNTIVTPFLSPVIDLSASHARACLVNNLILDGGSGQKKQTLALDRTNSGLPFTELVTGERNFFCGDFGPQAKLGISVSGIKAPRFAAPEKNDYHLREKDPRLCGQACPILDCGIPAKLLPDKTDTQSNPDIGAFAFHP